MDTRQNGIISKKHKLIKNKKKTYKLTNARELQLHAS